MGKLKCIICGTPEDEAEHMIGVTYNPLDHVNKPDVALCDECIIEAHRLLEDTIFQKKMKGEFEKLYKELNEKKNKTI